MEKKKYYVSVQSHEISQNLSGNNNDFVIHATDDEVRLLRAKFDNMRDAEWGTFWRAHVPIVQYHNDKSNDDYDSEITQVFQMLYDLGDEQTKSHIDSMGVLGDRHL